MPKIEWQEEFIIKQQRKNHQRGTEMDTAPVFPIPSVSLDTTERRRLDDLFSDAETGQKDTQQILGKYASKPIYFDWDQAQLTGDSNFVTYCHMSGTWG